MLVPKGFGEGMQQNDDIRYYLGILRRRYPYFLAAFLAVLGVSVIVAVMLPPIYRSEAKILVESQQIPADLVQSTVTGLAAERIEVTRQRITAREGLLAIADKYALFIEERKKRSITQLVDLMRQRIFILPFDLALAGRRSREGALTVAFTVGFEYERADIAAKVANELVTLILNEDIRSRTNRASETTQFLLRESDRLQEELVKVDKTLSDFKLQFKDALPERIPFQMAALERAESSLKDIDREINGLSESKRMLELEKSLRNASVGGTGDNGQNNPFRQLEALKSDLAQKSAVYSDSHPEIKALKGQIAALEKQLGPLEANTEDAPPSPNDLKKLDLNSRIVAEKMDTIERQLKLYTYAEGGNFRGRLPTSIWSWARLRRCRSIFPSLSGKGRGCRKPLGRSATSWVPRGLANRWKRTSRPSAFRSLNSPLRRRSRFGQTAPRS